MPVLDAKVDDGAGPVGLRARLATRARTCRRSSRRTRATSCFQVDVEELYATVIAVLQLQERRRTRLFLRRDGVRPLHVVPGLPAAGPVHHRGPAADGADPQARRSARSRSTTRPGSASPCWPGCTSCCGCRRATRSRTSTSSSSRPARRRRAAPGTRTSPTRCGHEVGEEEAARIAARLGRPSPRRTRRTSRRGSRWATCVASTGWPPGPGSARQPGTRAPSSGPSRPTLPAGPGRPAERRFKLFRRAPLSLTAVLPFFRNLGVEVVDERPYELRRRDGASAWTLRLRAAATRRGRPPRRPRANCSPTRSCGLGGPRRVRRAGPARARGRADLAAGRHPARVHAVPAAGRVHVQPGLRRAPPARQRDDHAAAGEPVRGAVRAGPGAARRRPRSTTTAAA